MNSVIFLLIVAAFLFFFYKISQRSPAASEAFLSRVIELIPSFSGEHADIKSLAFCVAVFLFILGIFIVVFR